MGEISTLFRLFVSSTFSDMTVERNVLQERVFPRLRDFCLRRGCRFQAIDLRWGVSEEASIDQRTMLICLRELKRCQSLTPRPNLLILCGDRYGWRPPPPEIEASEFERILAHSSHSDEQRLRQWYRCDQNAVPPTYCLQPRQGEFQDRQAWALEEAMLRTALLRGISAFMPPGDPRRFRYEASATHQEVQAGALSAECQTDQAFCWARRIEGLPHDASGIPFVDIDQEGEFDEKAYRALEAMKGTLRRSLGSNFYERATRWQMEDSEYVPEFSAL